MLYNSPCVVDWSDNCVTIGTFSNNAGPFEDPVSTATSFLTPQFIDWSAPHVYIGADINNQYAGPQVPGVVSNQSQWIISPNAINWSASHVYIGIETQITIPLFVSNSFNCHLNFSTLFVETNRYRNYSITLNLNAYFLGRTNRSFELDGKFGMSFTGAAVTAPGLFGSALMLGATFSGIATGPPAFNVDLQVSSLYQGSTATAPPSQNSWFLTASTLSFFVLSALILDTHGMPEPGGQFIPWTALEGYGGSPENFPGTAPSPNIFNHVF